MRWWIVLMSICACLMPWRAPFAQEAVGQSLREALSVHMPEAALSRMRHNPRGFVDEVKGLIQSYGKDQRISAAQIEVAIEAKLARLRAREMRWMLEADLNADLAVSAAERDVLVGAASASMQDRLRTWHQTADGDGNEIVSWSELQQHAAAKAELELSSQARDTMRAMVVFDLDGDGWIALGEVLESVKLLRDAA